MRDFVRGPYRVRLAACERDIQATQRLRYLTFIEGRDTAPRDAGVDADAFDPACDHVMIENAETGALVCTFRLMPFDDGSEIRRSYSAQFYNLDKLTEFPERMVEMGRFCIHPEHRNGDVLRVAWAAMTRYVDERKIELIFGCSSFNGVDADAYMDAFAVLKERHLAPSRWLPIARAPRVFEFARRLRLRRPNLKQGMKVMPPLLRGYISLGGWVSDHAVIDHDMNTLHVFTGLEIKRIPQRLVKMLRGA